MAAGFRGLLELSGVWFSAAQVLDPKVVRFPTTLRSGGLVLDVRQALDVSQTQGLVLTSRAGPQKTTKPL
ncbi:MAG TPA: hypothetical protein VMY39_06575 [Planctomycetota bacterium]|nr:hypothetical protein [Planctomycetota bacterium]HUV39259.1 hypothetical protein [Planctomycetota bacterium]